MHIKSITIAVACVFSLFAASSIGWAQKAEINIDKAKTLSLPEHYFLSAESMSVEQCIEEVSIDEDPVRVNLFDVPGGVTIWSSATLVSGSGDLDMYLYDSSGEVDKDDVNHPGAEISYATPSANDPQNYSIYYKNYDRTEVTAKICVRVY